jgi:hypothetical protein
MIDYKELLIKYIAHIIDCEGIDYTTKFDSPGHTVDLTDEEKAELENLAAEARTKYNS